MMGLKELEEYHGRIKKKGRAGFKIVFKAAPGDDSFLKDDPVAYVTVVAKDPITGKEIFSETSQMSFKAGEREVEIQVLNMIGVVKGMWYRLRHKEKPKPYVVTITVEPHPDWKEAYSKTEFPVEAQAGSNPPQHVWMLRAKPKYPLEKHGST